MTDAITKLARMGGAALGPPTVAASDLLLADLGLRDLLKAKNGFYAFEGALHVYPSSTVEGAQNLERWNSEAEWRRTYEGLADGCTFFAEDVFGGQFCLHDQHVVTFDPETGERSHVGASVEEWAQRILEEYDLLTGYPLAHEWQKRHGVIPQGQRLVPKIPFVLGGNFVVENLFLLDAARSMRSRANLAVQIRDLPEGSKVQFRIVD